MVLRQRHYGIEWEIRQAQSGAARQAQIRQATHFCAAEGGKIRQAARFYAAEGGTIRHAARFYAAEGGIIRQAIHSNKKTCA